VQHGAIVHVGHQRAQQVALEGEHLRLLLLAVGVHALVVAATELVGGEVIEDVAIPGGERRVPGCGAAARHHQQSLRRHLETLGEPRQERHPVEQLEADLAEPRPDDDGLGARGERGQIAVQPIALRAGELCAHRVADGSGHQLAQHCQLGHVALSRSGVPEAASWRWRTRRSASSQSSSVSIDSDSVTSITSG
jgi:hypothetical protein